MTKGAQGGGEGSCSCWFRAIRFPAVFLSSSLFSSHFCVSRFARSFHLSRSPVQSCTHTPPAPARLPLAQLLLAFRLLFLAPLTPE